MPHFTLARYVRYVVATFALYGSASAVQAQTPSWQTAVALGTSAGNRSSVTAIATDASGNVYLLGDFTGTVQLGATTLTNPEQRTHVFVAKWNSTSQRFEWAKSTGGSTAFGIAVQGAGVYITGGFTGQNADFGNTTLVSAGMGDVFVSKLTDTGNFVWARRAGSQYDDSAVSIATDGTNVFISGYFSGVTADFGATTLANTGGGFTSDLFVAKLTDAGSFVWTVKGGGPGGDYGQAVAVNGSNVYVAGQFQTPVATLGDLTLTSPTNTGSPDVLVAKLVDEGTSARFVWAQQAGGDGFDYARTLALSGSSVYVAGGFFSPSAVFGATTLTNAGSNDAFVSKVQDLGTTSRFDWTRQAGGTGNEEVIKVAVNGSRVYLAGSFSSPTVTFGSTTLVKAAPANDSSDVFVARLQDEGNQSSFRWAQRAGGTGSDVALGLAVQGTTVYTAGIATPAAPFGPVSIPRQPGNFVGFLASLTDDVPAANHSLARLTGLSLYPNPAHGTALVEMPALPAAAPATLTITDALGRPVRTYQVHSVTGRLRQEVALQGLAPGFYTLCLVAGSQYATCPLAVE
ncbi:T9SS type A sorting domain-containing protein [Hymenobacter cellulosilyticus]|uniref:T9SS type A sorting domain-containing protein n=1 Tax=Hymenobacter cellulosilyticus TaxID=2932248 RepID=A0A8T9QBK3_9BACT|nr:T9SS type A sorting domain-containing protein [Hymenobacter cellulosilyticus]UOQ74565.1 T9SS type A sorting domain-containing protein [Hymenobacter cellulosilyticus]